MNSPSASASLPVPTQDERTFALLSYVLSIFSGFIPPLVFFLVKKDSKFVSFHALQALAWHVIYLAVFFAGMVFAFAAMLLTIPLQGTHTTAPPLAFFGVFGFVWLWGVGGAIVNVILGIVYAIKASNGEWARYPLLGGWALRWVQRNRSKYS